MHQTVRFLTAFFGLLMMSVQAFGNPACVVCTVAIGASLSVARYFGVDDCVVGVWTGAFLSILGYWLIRFFDRHGWHFAGRNVLLMGVSVASVGFVYVAQLTYNPIIIGFLYIDSFLLSNLIGAGVFIAAMHFYEWLKMKNGGHAHFPFEKVVLPFAAVFLTALIFHYFPICNCHLQEMTPVL